MDRVNKSNCDEVHSDYNKTMMFRLLKVEIGLICLISILYLLFDIMIVALNTILMLLFIYTVITISICEFRGVITKKD